MLNKKWVEYVILIYEIYSSYVFVKKKKKTQNGISFIVVLINLF